MADRPIEILCCLESPGYDSGPLMRVMVSHTPTIVLEDVVRRIDQELQDRRRIFMLFNEQKPQDQHGRQ